MLRSLSTAASGMRANQTKLDVTGNNIANVNTVGFKSAAVTFQDTLSQLLRAGGGPNAERGGTNPAQIGLGVQVAGITNNFGQGAAQSTGRATDFMINGDGFFVTSANNQQMYTRAGSFSFDQQGFLTTADGARLQGWMANNGVVNPNGPLQNVSIPFGQTIAPQATSTSAAIGNLPSDAAVGTVTQTSLKMYDAQGNAYDITYAFTKTGADAWDMQITGPGGADYGTTAMTFDSNGVRTAPAGGTATFTPGLPGWGGPVTVDISTISQFAGENSVTASDQDGFAMGTLQSFRLGEDGTVTGVFSNGERSTLGMLAMATFNNTGGLEKAGNSSYVVGLNSGLPQIGQPGQGGRGLLTSGALEMSNVDLAEEFTSLIVAQRGFQANSRMITASDEILTDLVNMKR